MSKTCLQLVHKCLENPVQTYPQVVHNYVNYVSKTPALCTNTLFTTHPLHSLFTRFYTPFIKPSNRGTPTTYPLFHPSYYNYYYIYI